MTGWTARFQDVAATWRPAAVHASDVVTPERPTRFAALLDEPSPVVRDGDHLPPGWHVFLHLPVHRQASLGPDGHPRNGDTLAPPLGDTRRRMFGGGRLEVRSPLRCGDRVLRTSDVARTRVRHGGSGPLLLVTVRHTLAVDDELRVVEEQDLLYLPPRDGGASATSALTASPTPGRDSVAGSLTLVTDPVMLFRFSALTENAHRIHYDRTYAREVEGHRDLLVHGPLSALLLLELPRRRISGRTVARFRWRARRPAYVGQPLEVTGRSGGDDVELALHAGGSSHAVTGTATFTPEHAVDAP